MNLRVLSSWLRNPTALLKEPGQSETALLAFASTAGTPMPTKTGNEISDPPPATALIAEATAPTTTSSSNCGHSLETSTGETVKP